LIDMPRRRGRAEAFEVADETAYETFADPAANTGKVRDVVAGVIGALTTLPESQREAVE
jgi:DNA-directed RNA polymerase specialized sigma24 family protein